MYSLFLDDIAKKTQKKMIDLNVNSVTLAINLFKLRFSFAVQSNEYRKALTVLKKCDKTAMSKKGHNSLRLIS